MEGNRTVLLLLAGLVVCLSLTLIPLNGLFSFPSPHNAFAAPSWNPGNYIAFADTDLTNKNFPVGDTTLFPQSSPFEQKTDSLKAHRQDSLRHLIDSLRLPSDSLGAFSDSLQMDTSYVVFEDSTWRMQQWLHHRNDYPAVSLFPHKPSSLYLNVASPAYKRELLVDSLGRFVTIKEQVNGIDVKVPITLTLDEYISQRLEYERLNGWRTMVYDYRLANDQDGLGNLLKSFTNIEIPVPPNPIFSIFGKNKISLHITGAVNIRAGFRNITSDLATINTQDQSRNEPDFNQDVQITVDGTIGDKLKLKADWNTQRTFEYENSLKIRYEGYDDEIVKSVEAGNVSLSVPSFVGSSQALFGIKTGMQFGPLSLTALVSQKKGSAKEVSLSGGSKLNSNDIYPQKYSKTHFFVDSRYKQVFEDRHRELINAQTPYEISQIEVWMTSSDINRPDKRSAIAYIDLPRKINQERYDSSEFAGVEKIGEVERGEFIKLDPSRYKVHLQDGYISLKFNPSDNDVIAVAYSTVGVTEQKEYFGEFIATNPNPKDPLILKLVKPQNLGPGKVKAWDLMLKNHYKIGGEGIKKEGFVLNVLYDPSGATTSDILEVNGVRLLEALKLDRYGDANESGANQRFDFIPDFTIDPDLGELIFPTLRPFDQTLADAYRASGLTNVDSLILPEVYDTTENAVQTSPKAKLYKIRYTSSSASNQRIPLGSFNVVEGSVQVIFNGQPLSAGTDYTVNYIIGEVVITKPEALAPGANVQIKYEQNDLFQIAAKTMIGARGVLDISKETNLGFTIMNLNQQTLSDKVRLGEEPTSNTIVGVDASTQMNLPFLTSALNALPGLRAKDMSTFKIGGEAAYVLPDPNTKKSNIPSDGGASIAYIDDFEGARRTIPLSITYSAWKQASPPVYTLLGSDLPETSKTFSKAKLLWYNNDQRIDPIKISDIWPLRSIRTGQNFVSVMTMDYRPKQRGMYNYSLNIDSTMLAEPQKNWNGVMRYISTTAGDLTQQNIAYLELWVKATSNNQADLQKGRLFVDIGQISEDIIPNNGKLNSEDAIITPENISGRPNGVVNPGEDLGLDTLSNEQEQIRFAPLIQRYPELRGDPSGDDFNYSAGSNNFEHINGTEGNFAGNSVDGRFPDTEDLNSNGITTTTNSYLEYEIPLDTVFLDENNILQQNQLVVGGNKNTGWYQIRIPLTDTTRMLSPGSTVQTILSNVQFIRMWLSGFSESLKVKIAEIDFTGNQWIEVAKDDSVMKLSVVNIEDNPSYTSPSDGLRERDRTQPDQEIYGNEQSLALLLYGLEPGQSRQAAKYFQQRPLDFFNYKSLKLFIHGDQANSGKGQFFLRFGADTLNYYEYRKPLTSSWEEIEIEFAKLTALKAERDTTAGIFVRPIGNSGDSIALRGNPALTKIQFLGVGVTNTGVTTIDTSQVWVNELRVINVDNSPGGAYRFDAQLKLSDFGNIGVNYSYTDPNYHGIDQGFGDRVVHNSWAVNSGFQLDHFLPPSWEGAALGVSYSHQEQYQKPKYLPNSDVVVNEASTRVLNRADSTTTPEQRRDAADKIVTESQSLSVRDNFSINSFKLGLPWKVWYIRDIFNSLAFKFNYTSSNDRNPSTILQTNWQWGFGVSYGVNLGSDYYIQPFKSLFDGIFLFEDYKDWKIYYFPITGFNTSVDASRGRAFSLARVQNAIGRETRSFGASNNFSFGWKVTEGGLLGIGGDYSISLKRDLLILDTTGNRGFKDILHAVFLGGRIQQFGEGVNFNIKPKIPNLFNIMKFVDQPTFTYKVNYGWQNAFQRGDLGKSAGWQNSIGFGLNLRLKSLADQWFKSDENTQTKTPRATPPPRLRPREDDSDSTKSVIQDSTAEVDTSSGESPFVKLKQIARILIKIPFLDYETIGLSFGEGNSVANNGLRGGMGIRNFWGSYDLENGPSRLYQLGLISDPSGDLIYTPQSKFPFIGWRVQRGVRALGGNLTDDFSQKNDINLKTSRPLWDGANLDLNWKVGWQYRKISTFGTDTLLGLPVSGTVRITGSVERSYMTIPPVFLFKVFNSSLENVGKIYEENLNSGMKPGPAVTDAFERGLEALPFLNKVFGQFMPRANWAIKWGGIEKLPGLNYVFQTLSFDHAYRSSFQRGFYIADNGSEQTDVERISFDFAPLIGLNMTFKELWKGNFGGSLQYKTGTGYDLAVSNQQITEDVTTEMSLTLNYSRRGFEFPLFGLNLKNDIELSLSYSRQKKSRRQHDPIILAVNQDGTPLDGQIRTQLEPRIRYTLSSRVSISIYYKYSRTAPDEGGSTIPGTTTNEAGLDLRISIQ